MDMNETGAMPEAKRESKSLRRLLRLATAAGMAALLAGCGQAGDVEPSAREADVPRKILISYLALDPKVTPGTMPNSDLYKVMIQRSGRCCNTGASFDVDNLPPGTELTPSLVVEAADDDAVFYEVTLTDLSDTTLVEPLFGPSPHELELPPEITECRVMAGVRGRMLRAGMLTTREASSAQESRCNMVAMPLLLGLPEEEALDYEVWSEPKVKRGVETDIIIPRRDAINQYAACLDGGRYRDLFLTVESCP